MANRLVRTVVGTTFMVERGRELSSIYFLQTRNTFSNNRYATVELSRLMVLTTFSGMSSHLTAGQANQA